jgi:hypothetical protein
MRYHEEIFHSTQEDFVGSLNYNTNCRLGVQFKL